MLVFCFFLFCFFFFNDTATTEIYTLSLHDALPIWHFEFVTWDDPNYITENPHVQGGLTWASVLWALTTSDPPYWHPLTWLSHMLDVQVFGLNAGGHHLPNVLLHIGNAILLFGLLHWMTGALGRSAFVAGLFGFPPLPVGAGARGSG